MSNENITAIRPADDEGRHEFYYDRLRTLPKWAQADMQYLLGTANDGIKMREKAAERVEQSYAERFPGGTDILVGPYGDKEPLPSRSTVAFTLSDKLEMHVSIHTDDEGTKTLDVYGSGWNGFAIKPRASNVFRIVEDDR